MTVIVIYSLLLFRPSSTFLFSSYLTSWLSSRSRMARDSCQTYLLHTWWLVAIACKGLASRRGYFLISNQPFGLLHPFFHHCVVFDCALEKNPIYKSTSCGVCLLRLIVLLVVLSHSIDRAACCAVPFAARWCLMILWHTCCHVYGRDLQWHYPSLLDAAASLSANSRLLMLYYSVVALEEAKTFGR